jgi:hypothetical protein
MTFTVMASTMNHNATRHTAGFMEGGMASSVFRAPAHAVFQQSAIPHHSTTFGGSRTA